MVKSTKFAIAGAKRKNRNFIEICHTQVEITASKFPMAAIRNSGTPQSESVRWWVGMVVRLIHVCKIRVPVCAHESRVYPGTPRALFGMCSEC